MWFISFIITKRCLTLWIYGCPGKIQWNVVTWKKNYSHLHMEDITDADYAHEKRVCKNFEKKT